MSIANIEFCELCKEPTGRAGRLEDSLYAASGTPAEVGPLCLCCYKTLTNEDEIEALRRFANIILSRSVDISSANILACGIDHKLIDENGHPTPLLTGEK